MSEKPTLKVVQMPRGKGESVVETLRDLATAIERGDYGQVTNIAWVAESDIEIAVGLAGVSIDNVLTAYYLLGKGQRRLEDME